MGSVKKMPQPERKRFQKTGTRQIWLFRLTLNGIEVYPVIADVYNEIYLFDGNGKTSYNEGTYCTSEYQAKKCGEAYLERRIAKAEEEVARLKSLRRGEQCS